MLSLLDIQAEKYNNEIMSLLHEKYNDNLLNYNKAENDIIEKNNLINKLHKLNSNINIIEDNMSNTKFTYVNLLNKTTSINYNNVPEPLLSYSLDFLNVKHIFPYPLETLLNIHKNKDKQTHHNSDEAKNVIQWVRNRVLTTNISLMNLSIDKKTGIFRYNTSMRDSSYGSVLQYFTAKLDNNKIVNIDGTKLRGKIIDLSNDYSSLFTYFILLGFTEFYARCTCFDYVRKYSKRYGIANYFCPHILYTMTQMPYYLMYILK